MKKIVMCFVVAIGLFGAGLHSYAGASKQIDDRAEIKQLSVDLKNVLRDVESVRRDQVNYRIEKDLLKEAYSSNIQTINLGITMVLGVLGVLGYLGIRSIKEVRTEYSSELEKLRTLKTQLESDIGSLKIKQGEFENQVVTLGKTNDEQNRRLKTMELIEKISSLMATRQWKWAFNYFPIALELDPKNAILLAMKAQCHGKLGEFTPAIEALKQVIEADPKNTAHVFNLLEYLALSNLADEFNGYIAKYKADVENDRSGALITYLVALLKIIGGDIDAAKTLLLEWSSKQSPEAKAYLDSWSFDDVTMKLNTMPVGPQRSLTESLVSFFSGRLNPEGLKTQLLSSQTAS